MIQMLDRLLSHLKKSVHITAINHGELELNKPIRARRRGSTVDVKGEYLEWTGSDRRREQDTEQERRHTEDRKIWKRRTEREKKSNKNQQQKR